MCVYRCFSSDIINLYHKQTVDGWDEYDYYTEDDEIDEDAECEDIDYDYPL